jgi:hypothetical protein
VALPDFLLVGAPKAGTTALHVALSRHPDLFLSRNKEPKFFLGDGPPPTGGGPGDPATYRGYVWRQEDYEALFADAPEGTLRGESTTLYLRDPEAHRRIARLIPDAKLVAVVRDPVDRAHSNWMHLRSAGLEPEPDFLKACSLEDRRASLGWGPFWRYVGLSRYGEQLEHLFRHVPREQVLLLRYRQLREEPTRTLDRVCAFLGVPTGVVQEVPAENVTPHVTHSGVNRALQRLVRTGGRVGHRLPGRIGEALNAPALRALQREQRTREPLTAQEREALLPAFLEDISLLERVTGESFGDWRDPGNGLVRTPLAIDRKFGTGFTSIDRPLAG